MNFNYEAPTCDICECKMDLASSYHLMVQAVGPLMRRKNRDMFIPGMIRPEHDMMICSECKKRIDIMLRAMRLSFKLGVKKEEEKNVKL